VELSHSTFTTDGSSRVNVWSHVMNTLYMEVIGDDTQLCVLFQTEIFYNDSPIVV
jgi:hypothetical protein